MWPDRHEAESRRQFRQELRYLSRTANSRKEGRDRGQSLRKPSLTDSRGRKQELADLFHDGL